MIKLKNILTERVAPAILFDMNAFVNVANSKLFLKVMKKWAKNPDAIDYIDKNKLDELIKTIRHSIINNFSSNFDRNDSQEEIEKIFWNAINTAYNNDAIINNASALIKSSWEALPKAMKILVNGTWSFISDSTIKQHINNYISYLILIDVGALVGTNKTSSLKPVLSQLLNQAKDGFRTTGAGPYPYNINNTTNSIFNTLDNL